MKRVFRFSLVTFLFFSACIVWGQGTSDSLGDYARAIKKTKNAPAPSAQKKVYENDNLPTNSSISVVGNASSASRDSANKQTADASAPAGQAEGPAGNKDEKKDPELKPGQSQDDRKKALDAWKEKLAAQNDKVSGLAHEVELLQREFTVKSAEFYSNPANMAQHPRGFEKDNTDFKQKIADKQKELDSAKAKLSDMQDEARRAGAPNSTTEQN